MNITLTQTLALICSVCEQHMNDDDRHDTAVMDTLYGHAAYGVCPCCCQEVSVSTFNSKVYRRRCDRHYAKARREAERLAIAG